MARSGPRRRFLPRAFSIASSICGVVAVVVVSGAPSAGAGTLSDQISSAKAQAAQLASQIQSEGERLEVLSQQYDGAEQQVQQLSTRIAQTEAQVVRARSRVTRARDNLRAQAVDAYMEGSSGAGLESLFETGGANASAASEYRSVANANISAAIDRLHQAQNSLTLERTHLQATRAQAERAADQAGTARSAAQAAEQAQQATLTQVKGHLATLVSQQQAAEQQAAEQAFEARLAAQRSAAAAHPATPVSSSGPSRGSQPVSTTTPPSTGGNGGGGGGSGGGGGGGSSSTPPVAPDGAGAVAAAETQLGVPYVWGGEDPGHGFDCSGLTQWAWAQAGVSLPRTAADQYNAIAHVSLSALEPGDLLFWNDGTESIQHVAMYVGGGEVIQAPFTGSVVSYAGIWNTGLVGAGRP